MLKVLGKYIQLPLDKWNFCYAEQIFSVPWIRSLVSKFLSISGTFTKWNYFLRSLEGSTYRVATVDESGLDKVFTEAGVYGETTLKLILDGKHIARYRHTQQCICHCHISIFVFGSAKMKNAFII